MSAQPDTSTERQAGAESYPDDYWTQIIRPHNSGFDLGLAELWRYRQLIFLFVKRDFVTHYKQTALGWGWHFIQPISTTLIFTVVFTMIARLPTDGVPPFCFYMAGTVLWVYFSTITNSTSGCLTSNAYMFSKVYFPRLTVPISIVGSRLVAFSIQFVFLVLLTLALLFGGATIKPNAIVLLLPFMLIVVGSLALGIGLIVTSLTTQYRDLAVFMGFVLQLGMYITPVIYPLSIVPEPYRIWVAINPLCAIFELFRYSLFGIGIVDGFWVAYSTIASIGILLVGTFLFSRVQHTFIDTV